MTESGMLARWLDTTIRQLTRHPGLAGEAGEAVLLSRRYAAAGPDVWDAWTSPERTSRWLGTLSGDLCTGGEAILAMTEDIKVTCRITACEPPRRLAVIWCHPGEPDSVAEIRLRPDGDGTILELEHSRLREGLAVGYGYGWEDFFDRLGALLAGGDPDAISWAESQEVLKPLWQALAGEGSHH